MNLCLPALNSLLGYIHHFTKKTGIFCLAYLFISQFMFHANAASSPHCTYILYIFGGILSALLMTHKQWPAYMEHKNWNYLLHFNVLYCFPFASTMLFMMYHGDVSFLLHGCMALSLTKFFMSWKQIAAMTLLGLLFGCIFYPYLGPVQHIYFSRSTVAYECILILYVVFCLNLLPRISSYKHKKTALHTMYRISILNQLHVIQAQARKVQMVDLSNHPLQKTQAALHRLADIDSSYARLAEQALEQLEDFLSYHKTSFAETMNLIQLDISTISLPNLLSKIQVMVEDEGISQRIQVDVHAQIKALICDADKISMVMADHLSSMVDTVKPYEDIYLSIHDSQLFYTFESLSNTAYKRILPAVAFLISKQPQPITIAKNYPGNTKPIALQVPNTVEEFTLRYQDQIIDAHYGYQAYHGEWMLYVLPLAVDSIRSKAVDIPYCPSSMALESIHSLQLEKRFLDQLSASSSLLDRTTAQGAIHFIKQAHQGQIRKSGMPFYTHPLEVAIIMLTVAQDPDLILAALLHDTVEDTPISLEQISYQYGRKVARLVQYVTHLEPNAKKSQLNAAENRKKIIENLDIEGVMIKLADRLHNLETIDFQPLPKQQNIAQETLDFYIPLAKKINQSAINPIIDKLEKHCALIQAKSASKVMALDVSNQNMAKKC